MYKLALDEPTVEKLPLVCGLSHRLEHSLSYKQFEVTSRTNHLVPISESTSVYVDDAGQLYCVDNFKINLLYTLSDMTLPSIACVGPSILVCNGTSIFQLTFSQEFILQNETQWTLELPLNASNLVLLDACDSRIVCRVQIQDPNLPIKDSNLTFQLLTFNLDGACPLACQSRIPFDMAPYQVKLSANGLLVASQDIQESVEVPFKKEEPCLTYRWTQDEEEVIVYVDVGHHVQKSHIFSHLAKHLTVFVKDQEQSLPLLQGTLFDTIVSSESLWTLENQLLTLYLAKSNQKVRWTHLFESDDGILESMEDEQLEKITTQLGKFHESEEAKEYMVQYERAEEVDFSSRPLYVSSFDLQSRLIHSEVYSGMEWIGSVLGRSSGLQILVRYDVDGLVFSENTHVATFAGLGFVQASKQGKKYTLVSHDLEYSFVIQASRWVFIYKKPVGVVSQQWVIDLKDSSSILGVQTSRNVILILTTDSLYRIQLNNIRNSQ